MKLRCRSAFVVAMLLLLFGSATAQNLTKAEYFFDSDPGQGNGTNIPVSAGTNLNFTSNISVVGLPAGFHLLGIRVKQNGGVWSLFEARGFYISSTVPATTNITKAEYFIDNDPGQGNGTSIAVPSGASISFVFNVPTNSLSQGFHFLSLRVRDVFGRWSLFEARGFYITGAVTNASDISAAEYFFDHDPGQGSGTAISVTTGPTANFTVPIPTASLGSGFHFLGIRVKGSNGKWGIFEARGFYISGSVTNAPGIAGAEYFFDNDPGLGQGTPLSIPAGNNSNFSVNLPTNNLTSGFHFLTIRIKDASGKWGQFESRGFYVYPQALAAGNIVEAEYFIDTDPGQGLATPTTLITPALNINQLFPLQISGVTPGPHKLGFRVRDEEGVWSEPKLSDITVLNCTPPSAPIVPNVSRCNNGTVKLVATGATPTQQYKWYTAEFGGVAIFTGTEFTTPTLSANTDYYVSVVDPATTCESSRTKTVASILVVSKPVLNASGTVTLCEGASFLLSAPAGFASYKWSDGSLTQQVLVTTSGKYSVLVNNGQCDLPLSDEVTFTFLPRPATPVISVNGNTSICNSGSVTLSGPAGADAYLWSGGQTTSSITVSAAGSYNLTVSNAAGCKSESSVAVAVNIYTTPATPSITVTGLTALCNDSFSVLSAPSGFAFYKWSSGETTQTIVVKSAGSYSVQVGNGPDCFSTASASVAITLTGKPCIPDPVVIPPNPNNLPPEIEHVEVNTAIRGKISLDLKPLITDHDGANDIDFTTLRITEEPPSGAKTSFAWQTLIVDYGQTDFTGSDYVVVQVCDKSLSCTQQTVDIHVAGDVTAFNALSPNGDPMNEVLYLEFIDIIPDTKSNKVTIFNRWGSVVFEMTDYNNSDRVFRGLDTSGKELPNGTYFYQVDFASGKKRKEGFITLRR